MVGSRHVPPFAVPTHLCRGHDVRGIYDFSRFRLPIPRPWSYSEAGPRASISAYSCGVPVDAHEIRILIFYPREYYLNALFRISNAQKGEVSFRSIPAVARRYRHCICMHVGGICSLILRAMGDDRYDGKRAVSWYCLEIGAAALGRFSRDENVSALDRIVDHPENHGL